MNTTKAFTLTELIILLAIVGLLTCIAIPNFLEAKTATQISQAKDDMRTIAMGLETYKVDHANYPRMHPRYSCLVLPSRVGTTGYQPTLERLTTPVAYIASPAPYWDPFEAGYAFAGVNLEQLNPPIDDEEHAAFQQYFFTARNSANNVYWDLIDQTEPSWYLLETAGTDKTHHYIGNALHRLDSSSRRISLAQALYDPSNGTISRGSIWRSGGTPEGNGSFFPEMINQANSSQVPHWDQY